MCNSLGEFVGIENLLNSWRGYKIQAKMGRVNGKVRLS